MTDDQRARDAVYAEVFSDRTATRHVFDDMQQAINGMTESKQMGAWALYGYIQLRASAQRREQRRPAKGPTKTEKT